jgi:tetratricopeptide (TPR) repeat protein
MRELQTGRQPTFGTSIKTTWQRGSLYFAICCEEKSGEKPNIATTKDSDRAIWYGDAVEILLNTESHNYYQIVVNPSGALINLDRSTERSKWFNWDSQAEVATQIADDHWTVEIRLPVTQDENDPLHQVIGRKPTQSLPWHINVCRQRIRKSGQEHSAFSPTGTSSFHEVMKFAHFYGGRSHQFEADPTVTDYLIASRAAADLITQHKHVEALAAFTTLAEGKVTDLQKSAAIEQAAATARSLKYFAQADELVASIPIEAVKNAAQMQNLLAQRKASELILQFGAEDIGAWPFWKAGGGWFARGRAYSITKAGKEAEADLSRALEFTSETRTRQSIHLALGHNRENTLKDDTAALTAYRAVIADAGKLGRADEFSAVQSIARILTRGGRFDEALATLRRADIEHLRGTWRGTLLLVLGETQQAAGRADEAHATYQTLLNDPTTEPRHRQAAEQHLKAIDPNRP